jgi:hypothetical protein
MKLTSAKGTSLTLVTEFILQKSWNRLANKELHWTGIPLRSIPASELCRYATGGDNENLKSDHDFTRC